MKKCKMRFFEYQKFQEAVDLVNAKGIFSINSQTTYEKIIQKLILDKDFRTTTGNINYHIIKQNIGATKKILSYISQNIFS